MRIDLNDPTDFTLDAVRRLIAAGDNDVHNQLRVSKAGIAWLSTTVGGTDIDDLRFRLETWAKGSGCVGPIAACDDVWVRQIFNALRENWPNPPLDYIDVY
ncbi:MULTISPECIES: hypothetical protein [Pseudomonas]|uniref:Uncharacterized protein n=1 Tax=Pseudomonas eucalypticola TaxID=2599595 RepID=A0A7D5H7B7_9PSED|nr:MULTISPECIES: hypothetical protein [Pseudomonas]QKZ05889.1 hypothetical protein HWQ56_19700 [Pseudomonas eucalypticola]